MENQDRTEQSWLSKNLSSVIIAGCVGVFLVMSLVNGSSIRQTPLDSIRNQYKSNPTFSVILEDAKEEGNFFNDYFQKFTIVFPPTDTRAEVVTSTVFQKTSEKDFDTMLPFLGMTVFAKKDGKETSEAGPPGYENVGDKRYGSWSNNSGGSFWMWYVQYRFWGSMFGANSISRTGYNTYRTDRANGKPYYGPNNQYGTKGSYTKKKYPSFYERHNSKKLVNRASFSKKVNSRIGRNSVAVRSRSGGVGK